MSSSKPYVVIAGVDFSETGDLALKQAFQSACAHENSEVHVLHVVRGYGDMVQLDIEDGELLTVSMAEASARLKDHVERKLDEFIDSRADKSKPLFKHVTTHLRLDHPAEELSQLASDLGAELVVVGTHGRRGVRRLVLGSVAEGVVRLSPCAVLVVRVPDKEAKVPLIEPPCPACVEARQKSGGKELWCAQHSERHGRRHTYHFIPRGVTGTSRGSQIT